MHNCVLVLQYSWYMKSYTAFNNVLLSSIKYTIFQKVDDAAFKLSEYLEFRMDHKILLEYKSSFISQNTHVR